METTSSCFVHLCLCACFGFTTTILAGRIYPIHRTTGPMACFNCFRSNIFDISCICYQRKVVLMAFNFNLGNSPSACICIFHRIWIQWSCGSNVGFVSLRWIPGVLTMRRGWRLFGMVDLVIAWAIMASELMNGASSIQALVMLTATIVLLSVITYLTQSREQDIMESS